MSKEDSYSRDRTFSKIENEIRESLMGSGENTTKIILLWYISNSIIIPSDRTTTNNNINLPTVLNGSQK